MCPEHFWHTVLYITSGFQLLGISTPFWCRIESWSLAAIQMFNRKHVNELEECNRTMTASDGNQGVQIVHTAKPQREDGNLPHLHKLAVALNENAFLAFWSTSKISQPLPFVPLKVEKFQFHSHLLLDGPNGNGNIRSFCKWVHSSPQKCQDTVYAFKLTPHKGMLIRSLSFFFQSLKSFC